MAAMITEVYDALINAGASQEKTRKAAEALATYESPLSRIDADLLLLEWMIGFILAGVAALFARAFLS
ncbi:MAG: integrase [Alphaproteobacteria bacterium]|nr:integrase [Alphaproteobacteria bacterium]